MTDNRKKKVENHSSSSHLLKKLIAGLLLLNLVVYALTTISLHRIWQQHEARVSTSTQNIARILVNSIADVISKAQVVLLAVEDELSRERGGEEISKVAIDGYIVRQQIRIPELESILIADQAGDILYGDWNQPVPPVNVADREYFRKAQESFTAEFIISKPVVSRVSGRWVIPLVKRLQHSDGTFGGALVGVFTAEFFTRLFASVDTGQDGTIALRDLDLLGVVRYPEPKGEGSTIGQKSTMPELISEIQAGKKEGTIQGVASVDNIRRIYFFQKIDNLPFIILVGQSTATYVQPFIREALVQSAFALFFTLTSMVLARQLVTKWRRKQEATIELEKLVAERTRELAAANRQLEALSITDGLTGIANRRKFDTDWLSEWRRACRMGTSIAVVLLDVDFFKAYNDHYGHQQGDGCLKRVAALLTAAVQRSGELVARYGGEEFVAILPGLGVAEALETAERIRKAIEEEAIPHAKRTDAQTVVTVSLGVAASFPQPDSSPDQMLREADEALYAAKREGRNRICL